VADAVAEELAGDERILERWKVRRRVRTVYAR
jgi:hypothetical protein